MGVALAVLHRRVSPTTAVASASPTLATASPAVKQSSAVSQPQPDANQQAPPTPAPTDDASAFAQIATTEVSQLRDGITVASWMDTRGKPEGWNESPEK